MVGRKQKHTETLGICDGEKKTELRFATRCTHLKSGKKGMKGKMQAKKVIVERQAVAILVAAGGSRIEEEEGVGVGVGVGGVEEQ